MVELSPQSTTLDAACGTIETTVTVVDNGYHNPISDPNKYVQDGLKHTFKNLG